MTLDPEITRSKTYVELFDYEGAVKALAYDRSKRKNLSSGPENAAIVIGTIITQAESSVKIYTNNFNSSVYTDQYARVEDALTKFISNKGTLTVVMTDYNINDNLYKNNIMALFARYYSNNKNISVNIIDKNNLSGENNINFVVGDGTMYRLEYDPDLYHAEFCFSDTIKSAQLIEGFQTSLRASTPLDLSL